MLSKRRVSVVAVGIGLLALLASWFQGSVAAQKMRMALRKAPWGGIIEQPATTTPSTTLNGFYDNITHETKAEFKRYIKDANELIREKDWQRAAKALQEILDHKDNFSVEVTQKDPKTKREITRRVNARVEANRLIGTMPAAGLETYQTQFGGIARRKLEDAKEAGDMTAIAQVGLRYLHTKAGAEANELLATHNLDRDDFWAAALRYEQLLELGKRKEKPVEIAPLTLFKAALAFRGSGKVKTADKTWNTLKDKIRKSGGLTLDNGDKISIDKLQEVLGNVSPRVLARLKDWPMMNGNDARNGMADGSPPLLENRWKTPTINDELNDEKEKHPETEAWVKMAAETQKKLNFPLLSGFHPVAANGKIVFRTYGGIFAVWIQNGEDAGGKHLAGELAWMSPMDGGLTTILKDTQNTQMLTQWQNMYRTSLHTIITENSAVGNLTTDHGKVYAVDDLALPPHPQWMQQMMWNGQQGALGGNLKNLVNQNVLRAYELDSGKMVWELPERNNAGDLADSHFLGAPLPVGGKLYVLNEKKSELRLLCLDPNKHGKILHSHLLCGVKELITRDVSRRMHSVEMAYGEGILVIPTYAGAVLGVDLLTQSLIWSYAYRESAPQNPNVGNPWGRPINQPLPTTNSQFKMAPPVIEKGKVVFALPDGESIHCVDLRDGSKLWHVKRADDLYMAGVFDGKVLMVGKNSCRALSLETGKQLWARETSTPSGRGVASKGIYYLPVINKDKQPEITTIDLAKGEIKAHNRSRKTNAEPLGNLLFHEGALLSQSATYVAAYPQLDVRRREIQAKLKEKPKDPEALAELGELNLADGKVAQAVLELRRAIKLMKEGGSKVDEKVVGQARLKLYEGFTELFQKDFTKAADEYLEEYRDMCKASTAVETNRRQARFLYLIGRGREQQGKLVDAYRAYDEFASLPMNQKTVNDIDDPNLKVQPAVWVRGRIAAMMSNAEAEARKPLEEKIAKEWKAIQSKNDVDAIRKFVSRFDVPFQVGREARLKLADLLMENNDKANFNEVEMLLLQLVPKSLEDDPQTQARALEGLARLEIRKGNSESMKQAARFFRELGHKYPKTVVRDGRTGSDYFNDLATDKRFLPYLNTDDEVRITGRMKAEWKQPNQIGVANNNNWWKFQNSFTFEPEGDNVLPFFHKHRLMFNLNNRQLMLVERATNDEKWSIWLPNLNNQQYYQYLFSYNQSNNLPNARFRYYQVKGNVAVLQIGPMVYGMDLLNKKVLWDRNMLDQAPVNMNFNIQAANDGALQMVSWDPFTSQPYTRKIGQVGTLEASYVCIQTQKGLVALDPLKGTELWTKTDVPARTQIFGDDQFVYLVEVRDGTVVGGGKCLRASDGVSVEVPEFATLYQNRIRTMGRNLLSSEVIKGDLVVRYYDVHTGKDLWRKKFDGKAVPLRSEELNLAGVVEPDGTVTVVDLKTTKEVLNAKLDSVDLKDVKEAIVLEDADHVYIALNKALDMTQVGNGGILYNNFANGIRTTTINGMFYTFDRKGKMCWNAKIEHQMLINEQFKNMPFVLFSTRYTRMAQGGRFQTWVASTFSIDKKTGKYLLKPEIKDFNNGYQFYALNLNAKDRTIDLIGSLNAIRHSIDDRVKPKKKAEKGQEKLEGKSK